MRVFLFLVKSNSEQTAFSGDAELCKKEKAWQKQISE
jgi:hypothetical protein